MFSSVFPGMGHCRSCSLPALAPGGYATESAVCGALVAATAFVAMAIALVAAAAGLGSSAALAKKPALHVTSTNSERSARNGLGLWRKTMESVVVIVDLNEDFWCCIVYKLRAFSSSDATEQSRFRRRPCPLTSRELISSSAAPPWPSETVDIQVER